MADHIPFLKLVLNEKKHSLLIPSAKYKTFLFLCCVFIYLAYLKYILPFNVNQTWYFLSNK